MKAPVLKLWKTNLLSGEFTQGQGQLRSANNEYCCLGVLCELYRRETGKGKWIQSKDTESYVFYGTDREHDYSGGFLIPEVSEWAGFENGWVAVGGMLLHYINDRGDSFEQIAQVLHLAR